MKIFKEKKRMRIAGEKPKPTLAYEAPQPEWLSPDHKLRIILAYEAPIEGWFRFFTDSTNIDNLNSLTLGYIGFYNLSKQI